MEAVNRWLDRLPRVWLGRATRAVPTYRTCGIIGYYGALVAVLGGGLLAGRSLAVLAALAVVCGLSFFVWAYLRRWVTGTERIVMFEHVWLAFACVVGMLWALDQPVLAYLDVLSIGICVFLAAGRVGCLLVGCCHGRPSSVGVVYGQECALDGFPRHLVGIRLFPVQAVEAMGLGLMALAGLAALPFAAPGKVLGWVLVAHAVLRFGLEGLRGDHRRMLLGLSVPRWLCLAQFGIALWLVADGQDPLLADDPGSAAAAVSAMVLLVILAVRSRLDPSRRLESERHVRELRELVADEDVSRGDPDAVAEPVVRRTSGGLVVAVSADAGASGLVHVSLSLAAGGHDLPLLCRLAVRGLPGLLPATAQANPASGVLHLLVDPVSAQPPSGPSAQLLADHLYGTVVRRLQADTDDPTGSDGAGDRTVVSERAAYFSPAPDPVGSRR
jgi:prolipoprotein diacylglyceryltransferase